MNGAHDDAALGGTKLPARPRDGHKGTFGTLAVVGGSCSGGRVMLGAPALAALAGLRSGVGLSRVVCPAPVLAHVVAMCPSATGVALPVDRHEELIAHESVAVLDRVLVECSCLALGPGLGTSDGARAISLRSVQQEVVPVVVDADAINCLADVPELIRDFRAPCVLTPHPGEYRRIARALNIASDPVAPDRRVVAAEELAQRLGCIVVLKGAGTVVTNGHDSWVCERGHSCLATAGSGDVLTGLLGGLLAQHANKPGSPAMLDLVRLGVQAHALAGEAWAQSQSAGAGLLASELADELPGVLERFRTR